MKCEACHYFERIGDGHAMCMKDAIPVVVLADYERTKNYLKCLGTLKDMEYGQLSKEDK